MCHDLMTMARMISLTMAAKGIEGRNSQRGKQFDMHDKPYIYYRNVVYREIECACEQPLCIYIR